FVTDSISNVILLTFSVHYFRSQCDVGLLSVPSMADKSIYDFCAETLDGEFVPLSNYRGKVLLIVNLATF
uniref:Glutathione peroxidase n=1 Tax=Myripristis murdjan TaxID=586833 RepID=A0A667XF56_9TELE